MSDLISRKAAIDAVVSAMIDGADAELVEGVMELLPSAQPEQSIAEWQKDFREYINMLNIPRDDYNGIMEYINEVPSAQPEIIRCEDCTKFQIDTVFHDYWCDGRKVWKDHYCGYAERRTDEPDKQTD